MATLTLPSPLRSRSTSAEAPAASDGIPGGRASRWLLVPAACLALAAFIPQAFGREIPDTILRLVANPVGLLHSITHLWDPNTSFGAIQDQAVGYAFPMAPFYLLAHVLHVPTWIAERVWFSLLVVVAFWGIVRLGEELRIGSRPSRLVAGAAFALWPTFTILIGSTSGAIVPGVLLPWAVLPLVKGARGGSTVRAAALSGIAVVCMGGLNAASTLDGLILPAIYLITRSRSPRRRSLMCWWVVAVVLATAWWALPLLLQGAYGFNFLPYVEQANTTTATMSGVETLRGAGNWTAYFNLGEPWLAAGWVMVASWWAVAASAVVAAGGLFGLARRDLAERSFLVLTFALGVVLTLIGYGGPLGGPLHSQAQSALNGALAPFRNVYKFEPAMAVALVLGLAHGLSRIRSPRRTLRALPLVAAACVLVPVASPYLSGHVLQSGSFKSIPKYWNQVASYLAAHDGHNRALVVPASSHGLYTWGWPIDNPLNALATTPWAERELVPFGGAGDRHLLDAVSQAFHDGASAPGLPDLLARSGVGDLVVSNDLAPSSTNSALPSQVHLTLDHSGYRKVAGFGPPTAVASATYRAVEIYAPAFPRAVSPVAAYPTAATALVSGGPGALLSLENRQLLGDRPVVLAGDAKRGYQGPVWAVTDGLRLQDNRFGLVTDSASYTYTPSETNPSGLSGGGGGQPPRQILPFPGKGHQTVAVLHGASQISASSYGSWLLALPQLQPFNAFDGNPNTAWAAGGANGSSGQWIQIRLHHPVKVSRVSVSLLTGGSRPVASRLRLSTQAGTVTDKVADSSAPQSLPVAAGTTTWLRVTLEGLRNDYSGAPGAGLSDVTIPGVTLQRSLRPPQEPAGAGAGSLLFSFDNHAPNPLALAGPGSEPSMSRQFSLSSPATLTVEATAMALPGTGLDAMLQPAFTGYTATSDSSLGSLPQFRAENLIDNNPSTAWIAGGPAPSVSLHWAGPRSLDTLNLGFASGLAARPTTIELASPAGDRVLAVPANGVIHFAPLVTDQLTVTFPGVATAYTSNPLTGRLQRLPVGLSALDFPALANLAAKPPAINAPVSLACGQGPPLVVDGHRYATSLTGTVGDLISFTPIKVTICQPYASLRLPAGTQEVSAPTSPSPFQITSLTMGQPTALGVLSTPTASRPVHVGTWGNDQRQVTIGPGARSYLEVHENFNKGWSATLHGRTLEPVRLDGWQQGFLVPKGQGGTVQLSFGPDRWYRLALLLGALGVLLLVLLAVFGARLRRRNRAREQASEMGPAGRWQGPGSWAMLAVSVGVIALVGGPMVVVVPLLALVALRTRLSPWLAAAAMAAAGGVAAAGAGQGVGVQSGPFGVAAQALALTAIAAVVAGSLRQPSQEGSPPGPTDEPPGEGAPNPSEEAGSQAKGRGRLALALGMSAGLLGIAATTVLATAHRTPRWPRSSRALRRSAARRLRQRRWL